VKFIENDIYLQWEKNIIIPLQVDGTPAPRNPMEIKENKSIIGAAYKDPYFIVMTDAFI